jgi:hypothetical protein
VTLTSGAPATRLLHVRSIYAEPAALDSPRGRQVVSRFPDAEIVEVPTHWQIPELHGNAGNVDRWVRVKTETLVLGVKKSLSARPNGRSSDFIAPSTSNGCAMACASFATKFVNRELLDLDPQGRTRIHFSLTPENDAKLLDVRTSTIGERIAAIDDFVAAGYEVRLNFSPVVLHEGWERDWADLLQRLDDELGEPFKQQAACEIIMLTHNRDLHEVNLGWHPKAEDALWRPDLQQPKRSQSGMWNVHYRNDHKREGVRTLQDLIAAHAPWLHVRYAF